MSDRSEGWDYDGHDNFQDDDDDDNDDADDKVLRIRSSDSRCGSLRDFICGDKTRYTRLGRKRSLIALVP